MSIPSITQYYPYVKPPVSYNRYRPELPPCIKENWDWFSTRTRFDVLVLSPQVDYITITGDLPSKAEMWDVLHSLGSHAAHIIEERSCKVGQGHISLPADPHYHVFNCRLSTCTRLLATAIREAIWTGHGKRVWVDIGSIVGHAGSPERAINILHMLDYCVKSGRMGFHPQEQQRASYGELHAGGYHAHSALYAGITNVLARSTSTSIAYDALTDKQQRTALRGLIARRQPSNTQPVLPPTMPVGPVSATPDTGTAEAAEGHLHPKTNVPNRYSRPPIRSFIRQSNPLPGHPKIGWDDPFTVPGFRFAKKHPLLL